MRSIFCWLSVLGCSPPDPPADDQPSVGGGTSGIDEDGDGASAELDCDDADVGSAPGFAEIRCDGRDNDCAGGDDQTGCLVTVDRAAFGLPVEPGMNLKGIQPVADVDGDGATDLAMMWSHPTDGLNFYAIVITGLATDAPGLLRIPGAIWVWPAGDVDGDGDAELWVATTSQAYWISPDALRLVDPPDPPIGEVAPGPIGFDGLYFDSLPDFIAAADANGDGRADLVSGNGVCAAPFRGVLAAPMCLPDLGGSSPHVMDWNQDGALDVSVVLGTWDASVADNGTVPLKVGPYDWDEIEASVPSFGGSSGFFGDFDGDGRTDGLSPWGELYSPVEPIERENPWLAGSTWSPPLTTRPGFEHGVQPSEVGDVDGDGALEALGFDEARELVVLIRVLPGRSVPLEQAGWTFDVVSIFDLDAARLADVDGDGFTDVILARASEGWVFLGSTL